MQREFVESLTDFKFKVEHEVTVNDLMQVLSHGWNMENRPIQNHLHIISSITYCVSSPQLHLAKQMAIMKNVQSESFVT